MDKYQQHLIEKVNILEAHSMILWTIRDSKTQSIEMLEIEKIISPNCQNLLEQKSAELYKLAEEADIDLLEEIIRSINPGMIRMRLREIYKQK